MVRAELEQKLTRPEYLPYVTKILVDDKDRIWVFSYQAHITEPSGLYIYDRSGKKLAETKVPGTPQCLAGTSLFTIVARDEEEFYLTCFFPALRS